MRNGNIGLNFRSSQSVWLINFRFLFRSQKNETREVNDMPTHCERAIYPVFATVSQENFALSEVVRAFIPSFNVLLDLRSSSPSQQTHKRWRNNKKLLSEGDESLRVSVFSQRGVSERRKRAE